jgi:fatty-acyl-CoA synthase
VVTGVEVPGYDGRVGLAVLVVDDGFDVTRISALAARLPRSALPRFVRIVPELPRTASLKLKRSACAADGVDPARVGDPLWALIDRAYAKLDAEMYRDIWTGKQRL